MNPKNINRRELIRGAGAFALAFPGLSSWTGLNWGMPAPAPANPKRLVIVFSPNGMVANGFWPKSTGADYEMTEILKPLEKFRQQMLVVHGICNQVRGEGDSHMRGMSCLLTGNELFPGNIQGGGSSPAGWCKGLSIDQELKKYLQANDTTKTKFGTLEFGVRVPAEATPWTRMVYAGPNQPIAAISNPYRMFEKMYGKLRDRENLMSVLGSLQTEVQRSKQNVAPEDLKLLDSHQRLIGQMDARLQSDTGTSYRVQPLELPKNVADENRNMPELAKMQVDLLVNGFVNDLNRVATLQFSRSVGNQKMPWLEINEGHHGLSHCTDDDTEAQEKLRRINVWYAQQLAYLCDKLQNTKEPGTDQSMLENTMVVWTNELGHGQSHSLNNLPFVMVGGGFGFEMGKFTKVKNVSTTRLWLAIAHAMGHQIDRFGLATLCKEGPVKL